MKRTILALGMATLALAVVAQPAPNGLSLGTQLGAWSGSLVFGGGIQSPLVFNAAAVRAEGMLVLSPVIDGGAEILAPYPAFRVGLAGFAPLAAGVVRLYGVGGVVVAIPHASLSAKAYALGGWGAFGFEFFLPLGNDDSGLCYWIELGTNGSGATSEEQTPSTLYLNGFSCQVGMRWYM
ncbi:MAG: hypothetical protein JW923_02255 [Spirochaetales bacterium]|nr:hypothetical protein [Spirochaetales bacterium]